VKPDDRAGLLGLVGADAAQNNRMGHRSLGEGRGQRIRHSFLIGPSVFGGEIRRHQCVDCLGALEGPGQRCRIRDVGGERFRTLLDKPCQPAGVAAYHADFFPLCE